MTHPLGASVRIEEETTRNAEAVGLAYDHIIESFGDVLAEQLHGLTPEALFEVREELERQSAIFAADSLLPPIVQAMQEQGRFSAVERADFEWAFKRGALAVRRAFARVAQRLPDK